ncbi:MAG: MATE family efflux transporter [Acetatifactor sp.]|nr:MATE family efflux transporter [Acetatifactor sp.]
MQTLHKLFAPVDMTEGTPWKKIALFTVPMLIGNIAQQLYNTVDSIVVGKYVGDNALAAVGSAGPILNLLLVLYVGISIGAGIMVSQYFGSRNREGLSYTIGNSILLMFFATIFVAIVGSLVTRPMLELLRTPDSIIDWCASYLYILFIGGAGLAFYNILSGVLRGLGDSVSALIYLLVACVLNIGLDLLFVVQFGMGVSGVALATSIAQAVSALLCAFKLYRMKDYFDFKLKFMRWNQRYAMNVIKLGLPSGVTQAIMSMSMIVVQSLTNSFGEQFIAANVIVMRVDGFAMMPNFSFGSAMTTYAGQNVGANSYDRVTKGAKQGTILALGVSAVITGAILLVGRPLMGVFTDTEELVTLSVGLMRILAVGYLAMAVLQSLAGVMRGAGDTMTPMWISIFQTVILRVPLAYLMVYLSKSVEYPKGRQELLIVSLLISWIIGMLVTCFFYARGKWKTKAVGNRPMQTGNSEDTVSHEGMAYDAQRNEMFETADH